MRILVSLTLIALLLLVVALVKPAQISKATEVRGEELTYTRDALPIFQTHCIKCHNATTPTRNWLVYEVAFQKRIMIKIRIKSKSMPMGVTKITDSERQTLIQWVEQGAKR